MLGIEKGAWHPQESRGKVDKSESNLEVDFLRFICSMKKKKPSRITA